jgi:hypothetical protein
MTNKNWVTVPSEHDVYREYRHTTGRQTHMQNDLFIATMTREDVAKMTLQLIGAQCAETSISEGDSYGRLLNRILEERAFGELSFLVCRT